MAYKYYIRGIRRFNAGKVQETASSFFLNKNEEYDLMIRSNQNENGEIESFTVLTDNISTQGVTISFRIDGQIILELPWLASIMDVRFCYAYLKAVKKVHRAARISDDNGIEVKITDEDARQQWFVRCDNMAEIIEKGEDLTIRGWNRDFYIHPERYKKEGCIEDKVYAAFDEFAKVQWMTIGYDELPEEHRHVTDEEELSSIRVVDNTRSCFIGTCSYVGMMIKNTCKMVRLQDFYSIMEENACLHRLDYEQAILDPIPEEMWALVYEKAEGIVVDNFRKTFVMRWNTAISSYKMTDFEDSMESFYEEGFYYDWSIWDFKKAHIGDRFYMVRTGDGKNGIVMRGTLTGAPYADEDWSGRGRKVYYVRMSLTHLVHPDRASLVLTTEALSHAIPDFNWSEGHSGELLSDTQANQLDLLWEEYLIRLHELRDKDKRDSESSKAFKEKKQVKNPDYDNKVGT